MEKVASEGKDVILMGNLNLNLLVQSSQADSLLLIASENNLKQLISEPACITDHSQTLMFSSPLILNFSPPLEPLSVQKVII